MGCRYLAKCSFISEKALKMPSVVNMIQFTYCRKDFTKCARFMLEDKIGDKNVPPGLFPSQTGEALELLNRTGPGHV